MKNKKIGRLLIKYLLIFFLLVFSVNNLFAATTEKAPEESSPSGTQEEKPANTVAPAITNKNLPAKSAAVPAIKCKTCHIDPKYQKYFEQTPHGSLSCEICHKGVTDFAKHMKGGEVVQTISCNTCHQDIQKKGLHVKVTKFSCLQCHNADIHPQEPAIAKKDKAATTVSAAAPKIADCTSCHSGPRYTKHFSQTPHAPMGCTVCHQGIRDIASHMKKKPILISCGVCHRDVEKKFLGSAHDVVGRLSCIQCHTGDIHPVRQVSGKKDKSFPILACTGCHSDQDKYVKNGHTAKYLAGNKDAATCDICHGVHETPLFPETEKGISDKRSYYTGLCISCHKEGGVAGRYGIFPMVVSSYGETFHGKAMTLGYPGQVAGCSDCHTAHNILPPDDPASPINPKQLVKTCGKCHKGFHPRFVSYSPHPVPDEASRFRGLYLTKIFMVALLTGVFGFFGIHTLLWWRRAFIERSEMIKSGLRVKTELPEEEGRQYVRRFTVPHRIMHVVLVCSFLGIVVSGFPIKYPDAWASRVFITLFGGVENTGHIHRFCGLVMWALFLYTCWLALKFLFPGFRFKGWLSRLFGPDSLFPRIKDFQDCWGMFKWFFHRGEKPQFDRWTYWEKFDFMAVFWGMFVIGLSGIVMWIPELTSYVMPGWMINIMHMAHSEEALLAAVFIFMFHFFHNHTVPDKFPLEKNIFTGSYTLEALRRERPLEYERILKENRLKEIKCKGPGTGIQLFADIFGIVSILIGLLFAILIFVAVFST